MELIKGKIPCAKKVVFYGPEGIGKSTIASMFPGVVFIDTEGSTKDMDVARTPAPSSWSMLLDQVRYFIVHPNELKTLVIDTADWAEQLCVTDICARYQKSGIEDFGYGKGYTYLQEDFGRLLNLLTELVEKGVNTVLTAHAKMRKFEQPDEMGAYDRWEMKLSKGASPMVKEWADMVLFANYKTIVVNVDGQGSQKGKNKAQGGKRVMYTTHHSCWDAKNRYGLPEEVPFEYRAIAHIIESNTTSVQENRTKDLPELSQKSQPVIVPDQKQEDVQTKSTAVTETQEKTAPSVAPQQESVNKGVLVGTPDERIPKNLRDLMIANEVDEWDIQNVVGAKGHFPVDMEVYDYPKDYVDGCLVGAWDKVYRAIKEMKDKDAIVFN